MNDFGIILSQKRISTAKDYNSSVMSITRRSLLSSIALAPLAAAAGQLLSITGGDEVAPVKRTRSEETKAKRFLHEKVLFRDDVPDGYHPRYVVGPCEGSLSDVKVFVLAPLGAELLGMVSVIEAEEIMVPLLTMTHDEKHVDLVFLDMLHASSMKTMRCDVCDPNRIMVSFADQIKLIASNAIVNQKTFKKIKNHKDFHENFSTMSYFTSEACNMLPDNFACILPAPRFLGANPHQDGKQGAFVASDRVMKVSWKSL